MSALPPFAWPLLALLALTPASLKERYPGQFAIGAAIPSPDLTADEQQVLLTNFTNVTPENCMKPDEIQPREGIFTFQRADRLADFAHDHGLKINGHCLVWHSQTPDWFFTDGGKPASRQAGISC